MEPQQVEHIEGWIAFTTQKLSKLANPTIILEEQARASAYVAARLNTNLRRIATMVTALKAAWEYRIDEYTYGGALLAPAS